MSSAQEAELVADELAAIEAEHKAAELKVSELRSSGGAGLAEAMAELRALKPRLRQLQMAERRAARLADAARKGPPVIGSKASLVSARRLDRQRARMEARGGGMVF